MKKNYKIISLSLGTLIFILIIGSNLVLKPMITSSLEFSLNKRITMGSLWLNPFTGTLFSRNVTIWKDDTESLVSLKSMKINVDPLKLFARKLSISEVSLTGPTFNLMDSDSDSGSNNETEPTKETPTKVNNPNSDSESFIKNIEVLNITIEKLAIIRPQGTLKSMNTITLEVPDSAYKDNELDLLASLNILGSGLVDMKIKVNTKTGLIDTSFTSDGFYIDNTFSSNGKDDISLSGNIKGDIFLRGNYLEKVFEVGGNVVGSEIIAKDKSENELINSKHISIDLESLTFPEISLNLKKLEIEDTQSDIPLFSKDENKNLEKTKDVTTQSLGDKKTSLLKNIKIDEITVKRSSLSYKDMSLTNINLSIKDMKNIPLNESPAMVSFTLNDTANFSSKSLIEVLDYTTEFDPLKSIVLKGSFVLDTPTLKIPYSAKNDFPYEVDIKNGDLKGDYSYSYPKIILNTDISTNDLKLVEKKEDLYSIMLNSLSGDISTTYNLSDNSYSLAGPLDIKMLDIKDSKGQEFFNGDISTVVNSFTKDNIILDSVNLNNFFLNLNTNISSEKDKKIPSEKITSKNNDTVSKKDDFKLMIDDLKLRKGKILTKDLSFENLSLDGSNVSNKKIDSNFVIDTIINSSTPLKGDMNVKLDDISNLENLRAKGNISISNLDLIDLTPYTESLPYELTGIANYSGFLDYSKDDISSKGNFSAANLYVKKINSMEFSMDSIKSKVDFNLKKEELTLLNSNFSFSNLDGKIEEKTKFNIPKGEIIIDKYSPKLINLDSVSLSSPIIDFIKDNKGSSETNTTANEDNKEEEKTPLPSITASNLEVKDGKFTYNGLEKTTIYDNIEFSAVDFTTDKNKNSSIDASLSIDGIEKIQLNGNLLLQEDWDFSPKTLTFKGNFNVINLKISDFNNLLRKNLPNEFDGGTLSSKGEVDVKTGILNSEHEIAISKIDLGESTGNSNEIPLSSIISVLSDKYGNINITLPVTGDLTNPKLGITGIVTSSIMSGLIKTAKSPQNIISKILTIDNDEIKTIYFQYLSDELSKSETDKLNEIVSILTENPDSKVSFSLYTNQNIEKGLLTTKSITGIFSSEKIDLETSLENLMESRKQYILDFFSDRVSSDRVGVTIYTESHSMPQAKVDFKE